ncbi:hypothetical protein SAPIO_CDS7445 [Scedosporium apiospermum]|uniref:Cytochrome b mRNA-processing protein 4 n=1 Tax=Pseudallescheria apiosperma TaxID=563466 RepID=A0A084G1X4_PSEDA|nr:uncharacterized protein SAPIO_CDS7445 [Scedosporium apiospermum]KEZ41336.1 hypothetical protein SAPIO_CDS7445 [Scedosporium apiospermum]
MSKKPFNWWLWTKVLLGGAAISVGGPYLTMKLIPTQEELFKRYNPDLQKRSLENKDKREQEFDDFVSMIKQASKSDKHIWISLKEMEDERKKKERAQMRQDAADARARRQQMRLEAGLEATE